MLHLLQHETTHSLRISLNITQTSITFSTETTTGKESEEEFISNNQKRMKTTTKTTKAKTRNEFNVLSLDSLLFLMPSRTQKVVSIRSMILNQIKVWRYQEQIYIVPLDIVNFMLETHGESYTDKRTNKSYRFDIEQYAHHHQFLNKTKLASHPFLFVPICNGAHWWLWIADVNKKKFYVLNPVNKLPEDILDSRKKLNKFVGLIISQMMVYARAEPLMEDGLGVEAEYILLNGQRTDYDCGIYVMKWLETIDPQKIKSGKRYKYRAWTQGEIDSFMYQYGPHILLHEMNKIRDQVIWESEAIRLPKPSAALSSPYCKFTSGDLDNKWHIL
ncbi:hypothetical protein Ahy_B09g098355 [Arachis hypogaea]|uniref:Ubiquitin-like protease family profile domain-containing protein n=1 Tax=Arachis hypogaea TaxID=3818 RepID=A0A444XRN1_ARAHY|nr:hypothetical protein Ahy_B09g098355 [Arachis hypogaea]